MRVDFEPGHWERVRQITYTKCARKLSEQQSQTKNVRNSLFLFQLKKVSLYLCCRFYFRQIAACHRPHSMKYAVGLVMRYSVGEELLRRTYTCVIVSWDAKCQASDEWISRMTRNLIRGRDQPFYYVLTEDGNAGYVAEGIFQWFAVANLWLSACLNNFLLIKILWNSFLSVLSSTMQMSVCTLNILTVVVISPTLRKGLSIQKMKLLHNHWLKTDPTFDPLIALSVLLHGFQVLLAIIMRCQSVEM